VAYWSDQASSGEIDDLRRAIQVDESCGSIVLNGVMRDDSREDVTFLQSVENNILTNERL
jgi:hypothetical protein